MQCSACMVQDTQGWPNIRDVYPHVLQSCDDLVIVSFRKRELHDAIYNIKHLLVLTGLFSEGKAHMFLNSQPQGAPIVVL